MRSWSTWPRHRNRLWKRSAGYLGFEHWAMRIAVFVSLAAMALVAITLAPGFTSDSVTLTGNHPREAETMAPLGDADPNQRLSIEIHFATRNHAELNQLLAEQQNPASPNFHKWLKPGDYDSRFGARQSDID